MSISLPMLNNNKAPIKELLGYRHINGAPLEIRQKCLEHFCAAEGVPQAERRGEAQDEPSFSRGSEHLDSQAQKQKSPN